MLTISYIYWLNEVYKISHSYGDLAVKMASSTSVNSDNPFVAVKGPELFIGLVSPVGADLELICDTLSRELAKVGYDTHQVRLSSLLRSIEEYKTLGDGPEDKRILSHMNAGTDLREKVERGDTLALMSLGEVRKFREDKTGDSNIPVIKQAYVFRSLKHPDEVGGLRNIYGGMFLLISAYSPRTRRVTRLSNVIANSRGESNSAKFRTIAEKLVKIDEEEEGKALGQDVSDAFPMGDFFINPKNKRHVKKEICRFIEIIFGYPFHTPYKSEMGMYFAKASALRSADLSRQIGAVIANSSGDILSVGCNDVPASGGGQYWVENEHDERDFQVGSDSSANFKRKIIKQVVEKFHSNDLFSEKLNSFTTDKATDWILSGEGKDLFKDAEIFNLLEFGRPVHAEMAAITSAARLGLKTKGAILYSTTFPCHMCARHIISAGIKKVEYIEPYPKSKVEDLYSDSVSIDKEEADGNKVLFVAFEGIAPTRFSELFSMTKRKDKTGKAIEWTAKNASPKISNIVTSALLMEKRALAFIVDLLKKKDINLVSEKESAS